MHNISVMVLNVQGTRMPSFFEVLWATHKIDVAFTKFDVTMNYVYYLDYSMALQLQLSCPEPKNMFSYVSQLMLAWIYLTIWRIKLNSHDSKHSHVVNAAMKISCYLSITNVHLFLIK